MGVYKYDATNDVLIPIAGAPSAQGLEDKVSTYTADATYWDTTPTAASTKPVISDGIKTQFDKANNELADVNNILGSKNILPNKATTQVINGVTFTVSADGSINVNGTATADTILHLIPNTTGKLSAFFSKGGNYIISTGTTGAGPNVFFGIEYTGSTWDIGEWLTYSTQTSKEIYIDGSKLNNASSVIECYVKVNSGTTVSNIKVYPMLRPANIKDASYVPYAMTNRDLTSQISNCANSIGSLTTRIGSIKEASINLASGATWNANAICDAIMSAFPNATSFIGNINFQGQRFISGYIYWSGGNAYINAIIASFGTAHYVCQMGNNNRQLKLITTTVA